VRFNVCVNQASTLEPKTIVGADRGAKAAAEAGSIVIGMVNHMWCLGNRAVAAGTGAKNVASEKQDEIGKLRGRPAKIILSSGGRGEGRVVKYWTEVK